MLFKRNKKNNAPNPNPAPTSTIQWKTVEISTPDVKLEVRAQIDHYISMAIEHFQRENRVFINHKRVSDLVYDVGLEEFKEMKNEKNVHNKHFGIMSTTILACIIETDYSYQKLRKDQDFWEDIKESFNPPLSDNHKTYFLKAMDKIYLLLCLENYGSLENPLNETQLNFDVPELLIKTLNYYAQNNNLTLIN